MFISSAAEPIKTFRSCVCVNQDGVNYNRYTQILTNPAVVPFRLLVLRSGTAYQTMSLPLRPCQPFGAISVMMMMMMMMKPTDGL